LKKEINACANGTGCLKGFDYRRLFDRIKQSLYTTLAEYWAKRLICLQLPYTPPVLRVEGIGMTKLMLSVILVKQKRQPAVAAFFFSGSPLSYLSTTREL
jgi:hypothetical protein